MTRPEPQAILRWVRPALFVAVVLVAGSIALQYGFDRNPVPDVVLIAARVLLVFTYVLVSMAEGSGGNWRAVLARHAWELLGVGLGVGAYVTWSVDWRHLLLAASIYVVLVCGGGWLITWLMRLYDPTGGFPRPARLLVVVFGLVIVAGGLLLSLPRAMSLEKRSESGHYAAKRVLGCFFLATSATCGVGLTIGDVGHDFTRFGQVVILVLMQVGGLGVMCFGAIFGMGLQCGPLAGSGEVPKSPEIRRVLLCVVLTTLLLEGAGAALLYGGWSAAIGGVGTRWFYSVFHAVSAFCNAGLTLSAENLVASRGAWSVYVVIMPLMVLGGLGYAVLRDVAGVGMHVLARRLRPARAEEPELCKVRALSVESRLVVVVSLSLIIVPTVLLLMFESVGGTVQSGSERVMRTLPWGERFLAALFQSISSRTTGFNTVSLSTGDWSAASLFLMCMLMFVGGAPGGTAGGVRTTTAAILALGVVGTMQRRRSIEVFGQRVCEDVLRRAAVVFTAMVALLAGVVLALCYTESATFFEVVFEAVSACTSTGLSTGLTPHLTVAGKLVIMVGMFAGRLGPLILGVRLMIQGEQQSSLRDSDGRTGEGPSDESLG